MALLFVLILLLVEYSTFIHPLDTLFHGSEVFSSSPAFVFCVTLAPPLGLELLIMLGGKTGDGEKGSLAVAMPV